MATEISAVREKRELVDRVANSPTFQKSPRLREFLVYVADCTTNDRLEDTREQQIAVNVFNRKADYNSGLDNIVRVEARSLRKRLEAYFATEGKNEPIVISMPKGSYSICFESRPQSFDDPAPVEISYPAKIEAALPSGYSRWLSTASWLGVIALVIVAAVFWQAKRAEKGALRTTPPLILPFSALMEATKDTYIVTSDSSLVLIEELGGRQVSLDDYITGRYMADIEALALDPVRQDVIRLLLKRRYTNAAETGIAARIIQGNSGAAQHIILRSGHGVQLFDLKYLDAILFGSVTSNPPRAGEQTVYSMTTFPGESGSAYATVAFLPNVNGNGHVLLIDGTTAEGTEAAGEFIIDPKRTTAALKAMGIDPTGPPRYFEILLEAKAIAGSASQSRILASRLIPDIR